MSEKTADISNYVKMLDDDNSSIRREAVERLVESKNPATVTHIAKALMDENKGVQQAAADALINIGGKDVVKSVMPLLWDDSPARRNLAIEVLEVVGGEGKDLIVGILNDKDPDVRKFAVDVLGVVGDEEVVDSLISSLKDSNPNVRAATAEALGKIDDQRAIDPLIEMLGDEEWVRFSVVETLSTIGDKKVVPHLLDALKNTGAVQYGIIEALGRLKDCDAVPHLLDLMSGAESGVRNLSMKAVMEITEGEENVVADKVGKDRFLQYLVESAEDVNPDVKKYALKGLGTIGDPMSAGVVIRTAAEMDLEDEETIGAVMEALEGINSPEALLTFLGTKDLTRVEEDDEPLINVVLQVLGRIGNEKTAKSLSNIIFKVHWPVRIQILNALSQIGSEGSQDRIITAIKDKNGRVRRAAALALGKIKNSKSLESLTSLIEKEKFPDVIEDALQSLVSIGGEAFQKLEKFRLSKDPHLRGIACRGFGMLGEESAISSLLKSLEDGEWKVRKAALMSLVALGFNDSSATLQTLLEDENDHVRGAVVALLASFGDERALSPLLTALHDKNMMVRFRAAEALGGIGGDKVLKALIEVINNDSGPARIGAVKAVGIMKDSRALEDVKKLLSSEDEILRDVASEALREINESIS
ncbi:MAG: HEAT repeat domain-containing protein [Proteobacteria bacterium]|nr:HEAT repeat domain-containing protein [Pseudomonadota bacterium]